MGTGGIFFFILGQFFIPTVRDLLRRSMLFLLPLVVFFLLGVALIVLTLKRKVEEKLKKFLLLTGTSSAGFFIGFLLHNFFYGLGMVMNHIAVLHYLMEALRVIFFIAAIFICPLGFLIGMLGSVVLFIKGKKGVRSSIRQKPLGFGFV